MIYASRVADAAMSASTAAFSFPLGSMRLYFYDFAAGDARLIGRARPMRSIYRRFRRRHEAERRGAAAFKFHAMLCRYLLLIGGRL